MTTWSTDPMTIAGLVTGYDANAPLSLNSPVDITVDENNTMYVLETGAFSVKRFTSGSIIGTTIFNISMDGTPFPYTTDKFNILSSLNLF